MSDTVFTVIFWVGLAASVFSLGLIGLTVFLWARDVWITHRIHRMSEIRRMDRLRRMGDREWAKDVQPILDQVDASLPRFAQWTAEEEARNRQVEAEFLEQHPHVRIEMGSALPEIEQ